MKTLKDELKKLKNSKPTDFVALKTISFKKLIDNYRKNDLKKYNRLKLLLYYFPKIFDENTIEDIELVMKYPDITYLYLTNDDFEYKFTKLLKKIQISNDNKIKIIDIFNFFKI